jgi:3-oxoadipate enol-lactonase
VYFELDGPRDAPVLVLGSSLGTTTHMWDEVAELLSERLRVLRFDLRGHGRSPATQGPYSLADLGGDVIALLDSLALEQVSYCGTSLGGMIGMWLATHAQYRLDRLVLVCTSAHMPPASGWQQRAAMVRAEGCEAVVDAVLRRWFTPGFQQRQPDRVAAVRSRFVACDREGYAGCCEAVGSMDLRGVLPQVRADTLVLAGQDDPATPPEHAELIADSIPNASLVTLPDAAHLAAIEQPARVAELILGHMTSRQHGAP